MIPEAYRVEDSDLTVNGSKRIDLHVHTFVSGGDMTLYQQFAFARRHGISAIAVTDRDVLPDVEQADYLAEHVGVQFIPGVEITAGWKGNEIF